MDRTADQPPILRRQAPALATVALVAFSMVSSVWLGPRLLGNKDWSLPHDLWGTLVAAHRLVHGDIAGLYAPPTGLVTFPGAAVLLVPVAAVIDAAGLSLRLPGPHNPHPGAWLLAGPYTIIASAIALFAADAIAEQLGANRPRRAVLAAAGAIALWNVAGQWGHPEDAFAVGLLLYGILALRGAGPARAGWLAGAAIAVQPLTLLALPFVLMAAEPRRRPGFIARAAAPGIVLLAAAAAANWSATIHAVTGQPNWPAVDHPTPWTAMAAHLSGGAVAAGPARALTILVACGCALAAGRRWHQAGQAPGWEPAALWQLLWWSAAAMALRCAAETVMVAYYTWPAIALALIVASRSWSRLAGTAAAAVALTILAQAQWRGIWSWWLPIIALLGLALMFAGAPSRINRYTYISDTSPPPTVVALRNLADARTTTRPSY